MNRVAFIVSLALLAAVAWDGRQLARELRFNGELAAGRVPETGDGTAAYGSFAEAYRAAASGDFDGAVARYAELRTGADEERRLRANYNLANLFFRQALRLRDEGSNDLAIPLLELAKQHYREILREDNTHWDARFNLELALFIAPESEPADALAELNPERSPRALTKMKARKPLP